MSWPGFSEWLHDLGWLAFLVTLALWFVNTRLKPPTAALNTMPTAAASGLAIHSATYGVDASREADVTATVRELAHNNRIDVRVTNDTMGGDPFVGIHKRLRLTYSVGAGAPKTIEITEKGRLRIP